jgi:hypothetical protein
VRAHQHDAASCRLYQEIDPLFLCIVLCVLLQMGAMQHSFEYDVLGAVFAV